MRAFVAAAEAAGLARNPEFNSGELDGAGYLQFNIRKGVRQSAWSVFLQPLAEAPNLTVLDGCRALGLSFDGVRCTGVEAERDGRAVSIKAGDEVVIATGALATPQLLMLSGVGPVRHLEEIGVDPVVDAPAVGAHLQDHMMAVITHAAAAPLPVTAPHLPPYQAGAFARSEAAQDVPDIQYQAVQVPFVPGAAGMPEHGFTLMVILNQPRSRGSVRLASTDPMAPPLIDPAYFSDPADRTNLARGLELGRRMLAADPLSGWIGDEIFPGPAVDDLEEDVVANSWSFYHPAGSCAFGADDAAPLDPALRVRGIEGLRVADASAMPTISAANTHAPTLMIGERAADAILWRG
jgi:choline dehydrogenase